MKSRISVITICGIFVWSDLGLHSAGGAPVSQARSQGAGWTLNSISLSDDSPTAGKPIEVTLIVSKKALATDVRPVRIHLSTDSPSIHVPPEIMASPDQEETLTFKVTTLPVVERTSANVFASDGRSVVSAGLILIPGTEVRDLIVDPGSAVDAYSHLLTVQLREAAPSGGVVVRLISSDPGRLSVPDFVTVEPGESQAIVPVLLDPESDTPVEIAAFTESPLEAEPEDVVLATVAPAPEMDEAVDAASSKSGRRGGGGAHKAPVSGLNTICIGDPVIHDFGPTVVTDGAAVGVWGDFQKSETYRVLLRGYRYRRAPAFNSQKKLLDPGERDCIYCGCFSVPVVPRSGGEFSQLDSLDLTLPNNLPSGEYEVVVLPAGACPTTPGLATPEQLEQGVKVCSACDGVSGCRSVTYKLYVLPAFVTTIWETINVMADSEDADDRPAELSFVFGGFAGRPPDSDPGSFPVSWSGSFPGIAPHAEKVSAHDGTILKPNVPVFVGRQDAMDYVECREESVASLFAQQNRADCNRLGDPQYPQTRSIMMSGLERDCDGDCDSWLSDAAAIGSFALGCGASVYYGGVGGAIEGCRKSYDAATWIGDEVNDLAADDDDKLGAFEAKVNRGSPANWGVGSSFSKSLYGGKMPMTFVSRRVGGAQIVRYKVTLNSVKLKARYDSDKVSDIIVYARAALASDQDRDMPDPVRYPAVDTVPVKERNNGSYPPLTLNWTVAEESFPHSQAHVAPLLYVEFAVWESDSSDDEDADHVGILSSTVNLQDLMAYGTDAVEQGRLVRRIHQSFTNGVAGCTSSACRGVGSSASGADLTYTIEATWLKHEAD